MRLTVKVILRNDAGEEAEAYGEGDTVDEAIGRVEVEQAEYTGDDSWTMTDWEAA